MADEDVSAETPPENASYDIPMPEHLQEALRQGWDPAPPMGWQHRDPCHASAGQRPARHRHFIGEDAGRCHDVATVERRQRPIELGDLSSGSEFFIMTRGAHCDADRAGPAVRAE